MAKIVNTVCETMFTRFHGVSKVGIDFETAHKNGLASSISDCFNYVELIENGYKEDIIISYTEYDNGINVWTTLHNKENKMKGYSYKFCIKCEKKNQIEVTAELMLSLYAALNMCKY